MSIRTEFFHSADEQMLKMNLFLKDARKWLKLKESIVFVIGNESCDLDSAVCAVGLAYFYSKASKQLPEWLLTNGERRFLPVMNISRENLPLKTEVMYFMNANRIDAANLVCRDEVPADLLSQSRFVLVDHHVSKDLPVSNEKIIQIIDHHPLDVNNAQFSEQCKTRIQEVGSCATLVADEILNMEPLHEQLGDLLKFLRGPIVMDTINFSEAAGKVKPLDIEINRKIEQLLNVAKGDRSQLFGALLTAIADVSSLTAYQLLSKDLKIVSNKDKSIFVAIPGFPLLVEEYVKRENVWDDVMRFASEKNCDFILLMGVTKQPSGDIRRDLASIQLRESEHGKRIVAALAENAEFLQLKRKHLNSPDSIQCHLFEQQNIRATRKQVLPIVQRLLDDDKIIHEPNK